MQSPHANTHKPSLGAVLPLSIRGSYDVDDLGRTDILFKSLSAFAEPQLFEQFLIVTPPDEVELVRERCQRWQAFNIEVISEEALVPEFCQHRHVRGWRKQQIVKLAAARVLHCDFFITFDADVICLKPLSKDQLIVDGKALLQYELREQHPKWWRSSAHILKMSPQVGDNREGMTVTPALLSRDLCIKVCDEIQGQDRHPKRSWADRLCGFHNPKHPSNWTPSYFKSRRWTEYSLYYLGAHKLGLLDQYHVRCGTAEIPQLMLIHDSHPYETWDVASSFDSTNPGLFCVVGSKSRLEPAEVWSRIKEFIPFD